MKAKTEDNQGEKQKRSKKHLLFQILTISLIVVAGLAAGFYVGNFYLSTKFKKVDYSQYKEEDLVPNFEEVIAQNAGKSLSELSAVDAFVIAQYNLEHISRYSAVSQSSLTHNYGKQSVYVEKELKNGVFTASEISSSSMKSFANLVTVSGDQITVQDGSITSETTANWNNEGKTYSMAEYKEMIGVNPLSAVPYIVSNKTVSTSDQAALAAGGGMRLANGNYRFKIQLNTESSVVNYAKKIKYSSGISDYPAFSVLNVEFELDKDFNFVSISSTEEYSFKYVGGIFVTCRGTIKTTYSYAD